MSEDNLKRFVAFFKEHLFSTIFWWLPILLICIGRSFFAVVIFLSFYTSFTFWEWKKYLKPKRLKIYKAHWAIELGYIVSTGIFLYLTGRYVYDGLMSNYITHRNDQWFNVALYATAITLVLTTLTYMIKTGRKWIPLCIIYLLFDLPGAMPFNFLHFYENQRIQNRLDIDKKLVEEVKSKCDSVIRPKILEANKVIETNNSIIRSHDTVTYKQAALNKRTMEDQNNAYKALDSITNAYDRRTARNNVASTFKTKDVSFTVNEKLISELATNQSIVNNFQPLIKELDAADTLIQKMKQTNDREVQLIMVENTKSKLKNICSGSGDTTLQKITMNLVPNEPTQLESIKAVYIYIGEKVFSAKNDDIMGDKTKMLVLMSLIPSIIIDLLPLIFAIAYAKWCKNNEE